MSLNIKCSELGQAKIRLTTCCVAHNVNMTCVRMTFPVVPNAGMNWINSFVMKWKSHARSRNIETPSKIKFDEVEELKTFKTKAVTMFMVVQAIMGIAMAWALEIF